MSRHPGTVRQDIVTEFKGGRRFSSHEEMMDAEGFHDLEKKIMHLMRDETKKDRDEAAAG